MKQVRLIALVVAVLMFGALSLVSADDSDNACNGGALDGRCNSDWTWICGYYLQQWTEAGGWYSNYPFPDWCDPASLLPPKPQVTANLAGCYNYSFGPAIQPLRAISSVYYNGVSGSHYSMFGSINCGGSGTSSGDYIIEAPDSASATALCKQYIDPRYAVAVTLNSRGYPTSPATLWFCYET